MKQNAPIISTFVLGLFGIFGIEADEQTVLALINGVLMAGTALWAIVSMNRNK